MIEFTIIKQKRKTAKIEVDNSLQVIIKVPMRMTKRQIEQLIASHHEWIETTVRRKREFIMTQDWYYSGRLLFKGKYWNVERKSTSFDNFGIDFSDKGFIIVSDGSEKMERQLVANYFRNSAREELSELVKFYAEKLGVEYHKITIRNQATRWGSCSSKGNLSFNLRIMCAPKEMIEYVVLHEVMHLKHFNHSQAFWSAIEEIMPNYKECVNYFKQYGQNFMI